MPLIPESVLRQHKVHHPLDTRFRAAARLLQALWREDRDLPIGTYVHAGGKATKLGSRLSVAAGRAGENFLSKEIAALAFRETCYREIGAMIDEERLYTNLLSSMPLTFNLFGPLRLDPALALGMLRHFVPEIEADATQVLFEHSPSRGNPRFTKDYTAFDALIRYRTVDGRHGFVAFEVKYSETCAENAKPPKDRYVALSRETGLFIDPDADTLRANPLQQLWREHCLAQTMIANGLYDEGHFILIAPRLNHLVQSATDIYAEHLHLRVQSWSPSPTSISRTSSRHSAILVTPITRKSFIAAIATSGSSTARSSLHSRNRQKPASARRPWRRSLAPPEREQPHYQTSYRLAAKAACLSRTTGARPTAVALVEQLALSIRQPCAITSSAATENAYYGRALSG